MRNLEQQIAALCRKAAKQIVADEAKRLSIITGQAEGFSWVRRNIRYGMAEEQDQIGAVTGLAWTEVGGDTLVIEVTDRAGQRQTDADR